jgi:hypothetical protein
MEFPNDPLVVPKEWVIPRGKPHQRLIVDWPAVNFLEAVKGALTNEGLDVIFDELCGTAFGFSLVFH